MKLLDRYILSAFLRVFLLALSAFAGLYLLVDFFEKVDNFMEHRARAVHYFLYFLTKVPLIVNQVAPLAVLMGVFMTLGGLSRTQELTAMRSGGLGLGRITAPLLTASLLIGILLLGSGEFIVPLSTHKMNQIYNVEVKGKSAMALRREGIWFRENGKIFQIRVALPEEKALQGVTIFGMGPDSRLLTRSDAGQATYGGEGWVLREVVVRHFSPETGDLEKSETFDNLPLRIDKKPDDFMAPEKEQEELSYRELRRISRTLEQEGYDPARFRVDMQARLASPFATIIMAFLGIPFALQRGRGGNLAMGIALSVGIGVLYHLVHSMLLAFGYSRALPPVAAAWSANLLFALFGVWLLLSAKE